MQVLHKSLVEKSNDILPLPTTN